MKKIKLIIFCLLISLMSFGQQTKGSQKGLFHAKNYGANKFLRYKIENLNSNGYAGLILIANEDTAFLEVDSTGHFIISGFQSTDADFTGDVGLGIESPATRLHIYGDDSPSSAVYQQRSSNNVYGVKHLYIKTRPGGQASTNDYTGGAEFAVVKSGGAIYPFAGITGQVTDMTSGDETGDIIFGTSATEGAYYDYTVTGSEKMRITHGGLVGIGNNSPSEKLDVTGDIKLSDSLHVDSNKIYQDGTTGNERHTADTVEGNVFKDANGVLTSLDFGTSGQVPYVNTTGDNYLYTPNFTINSAGNLNMGQNITFGGSAGTKTIDAGNFNQLLFKTSGGNAFDIANNDMRLYGLISSGNSDKLGVDDDIVANNNNGYYLYRSRVNNNDIIYGYGNGLDSTGFGAKQDTSYIVVNGVKQFKVTEDTIYVDNVLKNSRAVIADTFKNVALINLKNNTSITDTSIIKNLNDSVSVSVSMITNDLVPGIQNFTQLNLNVNDKLASKTKIAGIEIGGLGSNPDVNIIANSGTDSSYLNVKVNNVEVLINNSKKFNITPDTIFNKTNAKFDSSVTVTEKLTSKYYAAKLYINGAGVGVSLPVANTYYTITGMTTAYDTNMIAQDSMIICTENGLHSLIGVVSSNSTGVNRDKHFSLFINDIEQTDMEVESRNIATGVNYSDPLAATFFITDAPDTIKIKTKYLSNTGTLTISHMNYSVKREN